MKVDRIINLELGRLNAHIPEKRLSLRAAFASTRPEITTKDGGVHTFKREELEFMSKILPEDDWDRLQLPIFISLEPKLGRGAARIRGEAEAKVVGCILGKEKVSDELIIYRPEVAAIRRKLPTTTQYIFIG
ncbi:MAG: DUF61 family protein [Methanobacteriota archaeon]